MEPVPGFYARDGLNVQTYDLRTDQDIAGTTVAGDVDWYVRRCAGWGGPVLEAACGTGRVSWALAEEGLEVVGFDLSPAMLAAAEAKRGWMPAGAGDRIRFVPGDMTTFDLGRTFRVILVPFRAFQALLDPPAQRAALERFRAHLAPGGRLVLDLFDPRYEYLSPVLPPALADRDTVRHPERGTRVTLDMVRLEFDPVRQVFRDRWTFREHDASGEVLLEESEDLVLRWSFRWEMRHLFEIAGLEVEEERSDFRDSPPAYAGEQIWILRKR